ncbi:MAG: DUF4349 domain-containing protein, partial [Ilumatobacteraceae bacterium]
VEIVPTSSLPEPDDDGDSIRDAFTQGIDAFVEFVRVVVLVLAVTFPFLLVAGLAGTVIVVFRRRRRVTSTESGGTNPTG